MTVLELYNALQRHIVEDRGDWTIYNLTSGVSDVQKGAVVTLYNEPDRVLDNPHTKAVLIAGKKPL